MLRLKTQESKFTTSMRIGMMAAYGVGDAGIAKPRFGMIARIFRPAPQTVIVDIVKHGEYLEPVIVSSDPTAFDRDEKVAGLLLGAIIIKARRRDQAAVAAAVHAARTGRPDDEADAGAQKIKLGKLQTVTRDFYPVPARQRAGLLRL
jgi:hypothetical protein